MFSGAAGTIVVLLSIGTPAPQRRLDAAVRLGDFLLLSAERSRTGWSWRTSGRSTRNLLGFAHGASGIGYALLELFAVVGDDRYLQAAEGAFRYENSRYSAAARNWPDLRVPIEQTRMTEGASGQAIDLAQLYAVEQYMTAWCHGAPGITIARLRAWQLLGRSDLLDDVTVGLAATTEWLESSDTDGRDYSLCHGMCGNAEVLLYASDVLKQPSYRSIATEVAARGLQRFGAGSTEWPCGTLDRAYDPSLMVGVAGIGHHLLRLIDSSVAPIIRLPCTAT